MNKIKLFLDFDDVIGNSKEAICKMYNKQYKNDVGFTKANHELVRIWGFEDQCTLIKAGEMCDYFSSKEFFNILKPNADAIEVINILKEDFDIVIVTIGTQLNIHYKALWIKKYLPDIEAIYIYNGNGCNMDKSIINMHNGILIDDHYANLESSNASMKIVFGEETEYNVCDLIRTKDWKELLILLTITNKTLTDVDVLSEDENEYWKEIRESISAIV